MSDDSNEPQAAPEETPKEREARMKAQAGSAALLRLTEESVASQRRLGDAFERLAESVLSLAQRQQRDPGAGVWGSMGEASGDLDEVAPGIRKGSVSFGGPVEVDGRLNRTKPSGFAPMGDFDGFDAPAPLATLSSVGREAHEVAMQAGELCRALFALNAYLHGESDMPFPKGPNPEVGIATPADPLEALSTTIGETARRLSEAHALISNAVVRL